MLEDLRVIERTPAWTANRLSRMVKAPKYYVVDPGVGADLTGDNRSGVLRDAGHLAWLRDRRGSTFHRGIVLYAGQPPTRSTIGSGPCR